MVDQVPSRRTVAQRIERQRLAQHLAGHANMRTTAIYADVTPWKERERLAAYLK